MLWERKWGPEDWTQRVSFAVLMRVESGDGENGNLPLGLAAEVEFPSTRVVLLVLLVRPIEGCVSPGEAVVVTGGGVGSGNFINDEFLEVVRWFLIHGMFEIWGQQGLWTRTFERHDQSGAFDCRLRYDERCVPALRLSI